MKNKNKINLFLDLDDTTVQSSKRFVDLANEYFETNQDHSKLTKWDFSDLYPNITQEVLTDIFCHDAFYNDIPVQPGSIEVLKKIKNHINLTLVTTGAKLNVEHKKQWAKDNLSFLDYKYIGLEQERNYNKSSINMRGGILIDDRIDTLKNSNASIKILFMPLENRDWQKLEPNDTIYVTKTWEDIGCILNFLIHNPNFIGGNN